MSLSNLDLGILAAFFFLYLIIGLISRKAAGKSAKNFFLSGSNVPWWLLGVSMVATTFAADTPNLVTDIVRKNGIAGNWVWWAFLLTGMITVFFYSRLWRRSGILTDLEFYELRYSGKPAAFLRAFRAVYLGVVFNVVTMAVVNLAAIKIAAIMLGVPAWQTLLVMGIVIVLYSASGGLRSVLITDFFQFIVAITGAVWAASIALKHEKVGGLAGLINHPDIIDKLSFFPSFDNKELIFSLLIVPLAVQWWAAWYPGAEPGGGGYIAQRMLAAKDEKHALKATLFFNFAHYALRPWPWIIVALCSILVFPDLQSISDAFPAVSSSDIADDIAYPAMLTFLPAGALGLVLASLASAYMSTISTHLNWGSSYMVNDVYKRFVKTDASEKELVSIGRLSIVIMMILSAILALYMDSALDGFNIILQIGAGTGLIYLLRWFWWRINAYTEIAGMVISFVVAMSIGFFNLPNDIELITGVAITTIGWLLVAFLTQPESKETLRAFYTKIQPGGIGWKSFLIQNPDLPKGQSSFAKQFLAAAGGVIFIYGCLFLFGNLLYGRWEHALYTSVLVIIGFLMLQPFFKEFRKKP